MGYLSGINKTIRLPNTPIMKFFVQLLFFFFSRMFVRILQQYIYNCSKLYEYIPCLKKMCFCEKQLSLNAENANAIDKLYNYVYIFIYLFFVKKELYFWGKTYHRRKNSIDQWIWNYIHMSEIYLVLHSGTVGITCNIILSKKQNSSRTVL